MQSENPLESDPTLANRYLAGQLSEQDQKAFEAALAAQPALLRDLEAAARFKVGLAKLREDGELDALLAPRRVTHRWLALAAAVTALGIGLLLLRITANPPVLAASLDEFSSDEGRLSVAASFTIYSKRGAADLRIELPPTRQAIELRVLPGAAATAPYRLALARVDPAGSERSVGAELLQQADRDSGLVIFYADSAQLEPGNYRITLSQSDSATLERFAIEVVRRQ